MRALMAATIAGCALAGSALVPTVAGADARAATCLGQEVTIDLNDPDHADPARAASDVVLGTPETDRLHLKGGDDVVCAGDGWDTVAGNGGDDRIDGGAGSGSFMGGLGEDEVRGSGYLYGGRGRDVLRSLAEAEDADPGSPGTWAFLNGGPGDDRLVGGEGRDDSASYIGAGRAVEVDLRVHRRQETGDGRDLLVDIEGVAGTEYDDVLVGSRGANYLYGWLGDDRLLGLAGDDDLEGSRGDDRLRGGAGTDVCRGGSGTGDVRTGCE